MPNYRQSESIRQHFRRGQALAFGKGDVLLGNQLTPDGVYFVDTGYVKAYSISDDGSEYLHIIYGSGEIFPLVWAYVNFQPEVLFYEAISECTVWRISREWLTNMVSSDISFSKAMAVQMAQQFRVYIERVDNLEHKKAGEQCICSPALFMSQCLWGDTGTVLLSHSLKPQPGRLSES